MEKINIDEEIEKRRLSRIAKDWKTSDQIRDRLDLMNVFIFDTPDGQEVYHLTEEYFLFKNKSQETFAMTNRQFVELNIKKDQRSNKNFEAWLFTNKP